MQCRTTTRNAFLSAIATDMGAGGTCKTYTGSSPGVANAVTGTLLSTVTGVTFGTPSGGAMTFTSTADTSAAASGTPGYQRYATSGGVAIYDFTAAIGSGEANFSGAVSLGGSVTEASGSLTAGNA